MTAPGFLRWRSWGAAERRALLLHDAGSSSGTWWQTGEALAEAGWRVKAPDLPSHGASPRLAAPLSPQAAADWLLADLASRPIDLVVGHGFGGAVALTLLERGHVLDLVVLEDYPEAGRHWPLAADELLSAGEQARRDPDTAYEEFRRVRPEWAEQDCRQAVRDLASCAVEEVADGLRGVHAWPQPATADEGPVIVSSISHRRGPEEWVRTLTDLASVSPAG